MLLRFHDVIGIGITEGGRDPVPGPDPLHRRKSGDGPGAETGIEKETKVDTGREEAAPEIETGTDGEIGPKGTGIVTEKGTQ